MYYVFVSLLSLPMSTGKHSKAAFMGLALLMVFSLTSLEFSKLGGVLLRDTADIGVEHLSPLSLYVEVGRLSNSAMIDIFSDGDEVVKISVPDDWRLREVRNATVADITSDEPTFGFSRWYLPPHSGASFYAFNGPESILLHNPSGVQLKVNVVNIEIEAETVERNIILVTDSSVKLY
jgi:hypothetical protein